MFKLLLSFFFLQGLTNSNTTAAYCVENKILTSNAHFLANSPDTTISPFLQSQTFTMFPPALTRLPFPKVSPLFTPCIKPTKQMATYIATPDNFNAPFDAMQNAGLPFKHSSLYIAIPNTSSNIQTTKVQPAKKSSEPTPTRVQRTQMALTPEQVSAIISRSIIIANQERLQRSNASAIYESATTNKHESTEMGRSHSIFQASDKINHNAKIKLKNDITHRITFSPIIPRKRNHPFASNKRPTKKKLVRSDNKSNNIKNTHNNQVAASDTFKTSARTTEGLHAKKSDIVGSVMERYLQRMPPFQNPTDASGDVTETVNSETCSLHTHISPFLSTTTKAISIPTTAPEQTRRYL
jgi:hypothetical protein